MATNAEYAFKINQDAGGYPSNSQALTFGLTGSHADFVLPMVRFEFLEPTGQNPATGSPLIYMRLGGTFQTAMSNGYNESQNIFGDPRAGGAENEAGVGSFFKNFAGTGSSLTESIFKQISGAASGALGYIKSGGLTGKAQYEFASRRMLNTFQQLIYQGPTFRRFSLPFTMRPTSLQEAQNMIAIINSFRHASSPKADAGGTMATVVDTTSIDFQTRKEANTLTPEETELLKTQTATDISIDANREALTGGVYTFGYPDMCEFRILLTKGGGGTISTLFESETCVIENVSIDYGSQNKMVFFDAPSGGKYYPTDVTLTLSLKETTLLTTGSIKSRSGSAENTIY